MILLTMTWTMTKYHWKTSPKTNFFLKYFKETVIESLTFCFGTSPCFVTICCFVAKQTCYLLKMVKIC